MTFINTTLMKHPMNWVIIFLMVVIAGLGAHIIISHFQQSTPPPVKS